MGGGLFYWRGTSNGYFTAICSNVINKVSLYMNECLRHKSILLKLVKYYTTMQIRDGSVTT